jgi:hypothetical protein
MARATLEPRQTQRRASAESRRPLSSGALRSRRKFLQIFPGGFTDPDYLELERDYKWRAHEQWLDALGPASLGSLLQRGRETEAAALAVTIESRTNLLFSFEKMALRDAVRSADGARIFARGLFDLLHGTEDLKTRFSRWCDAVARLPRRQTRVLTWPLVTVFGFIAQPTEHIFLKPRVTQVAAEAYGYDFEYVSRPNWTTYTDLLNLAAIVRRENRDLRPRDYIDLQSFLWVLGSDEYED